MEVMSIHLSMFISIAAIQILGCMIPASGLKVMNIILCSPNISRRFNLCEDNSQENQLVTLQQHACVHIKQT